LQHIKGKLWNKAREQRSPAFKMDLPDGWNVVFGGRSDFHRFI
jgi:hypothetical protein